MVNRQKILIVDDDENIAELLSLYLTKECFDTKMVYNGEDALREHDTWHPNLILLDLMLPDALTALRELDGLSERQRPCIFVLSSFVSAEISAECDRLGINFFLRKPVSIASLIDILSRYGAAARLSAPHASEAPTQYDIVLQIRHLLGDLQFPAHVMGYRYLRDSILMTI